MSESVDLLTSMLASGRPWVALTGAGVSEASGIPTYRDHHGNWLGSQPIQHTEFVESAAKRQRYWSRSALGWPRVDRAVPNATHVNLARLEHSGVVSGVITQNVDRLHQQAGSTRVIDLHGRLDQVLCLGCGHTEPRSNIQQWLVAHNDLTVADSLTIRPDGDADLPHSVVENFQIPACPSCGGTLMPAVVFFGGTVPQATVASCYELIDASEGMLVLGSSLSVYSGFRFCRYASQQGKPIVILNQGETRADDLCELRFSDAPFDLLQQCVERMSDPIQESLHG